MKKVLAIACYMLIVTAIAQDSKKPTSEPKVYECVRWRYKDFVKYEVECLEWRIKDCSNRLYKDICKLGG